MDVLARMLVFSRVSRALWKFFTMDIHLDACGNPARKLPLWAAFSFLILVELFVPF